MARRMREEAVKQVSEMETKLEKRKKRLMNEAQRRVSLTREQVKEELQKLRIQRERILEERVKFGKWQQHRILQDKLQIRQQVATYNVTVTDITEKVELLHRERAEQERILLARDEERMKRLGKERDDEIARTEKFRLERL